MDSQNEANKIHLSDLKPKMHFVGKVTKLELFGAFVDIGAEQPGLVHISKLMHGHVNRIQDVIKEGQKVDVWVQKVDPESGRIELTMIKPITLPWKNIKPGVKLSGKIVRLENFGAFIDIGAERPGLVHVSEMSSDYVNNPAEIVNIGDKVDVVVLDLDRKKRQIRLSMKQFEEKEQAEALLQEDEIVPTAMELALRQALNQTDTETNRPTKKTTSSRKQSPDELEDIFSRTLKQRMKNTASSEK